MPNGQRIGVGFMWLWWNERGEITEASVLIAEDIAIEDLRSVMLEELFQTLGFIYDVENRYYEGRSILSQDSNATTTLIGQDRKALRRLYP
jgi:predicted RNA-binding protein Jag